MDFNHLLARPAELIDYSISDDLEIQTIATPLWEISYRQSDFCFARSMKSAQLHL
jgi:hypothetical protein